MASHAGGWYEDELPPVTGADASGDDGSHPPAARISAASRLLASVARELMSRLVASWLGLGLGLGLGFGFGFGFGFGLGIGLELGASCAAVVSCGAHAGVASSVASAVRPRCGQG